MELSEKAKHLERHCREKEENLRYVRRMERELRRDLSDLGQAFRREVIDTAELDETTTKPDRETLKIASRCKNVEHWCGRAVCTSFCGALLFHGPGHQSKSHCERTDDHTVHSYGGWQWEGDKGSSGVEL